MKVGALLSAGPLLLPIFSRRAIAQTVSPTSLSFTSSSELFQTCSQPSTASITLPGCSSSANVDVFLLFDDTGSFQNFVPLVAKIFRDVVTGLAAAAPCVDFGFGVGRYEDYGGPGRTFGGANFDNRPFLLDQPIITAADVGGETQLIDLINVALNRTAPGNGGDAPEAAIAEGLWQTAVGIGFSGNGSGMLGFNGQQVAGAIDTMIHPDYSGDVPPFSSLLPSVPHSGNVGGAGFRSNALKLVIIATDTCSVAAFNGTTIPATISTKYATEATTDLTCSGTPGVLRFGFVSDAYSAIDNTIPNAVVPKGAGTVPGTVQALVDQGIRVIGLARNGGAVPPGTGPSQEPNVFMSALARLTGAVDSSGNPLVFQTNLNSTQSIINNIVNAVSGAIGRPLDVALSASSCTMPGSPISVNISPATQAVSPGGTASFTVGFTVASGRTVSNLQCSLVFTDSSSSLSLGTIPVTINGGPCGIPAPTTPAPVVPPTKMPTSAPIPAPTKPPTRNPTKQPTKAPTRQPTKPPTKAPSKQPTKAPTKAPSLKPSFAPTSKPTSSPTLRPTARPTAHPTTRPTLPPTPGQPTPCPTKNGWGWWPAPAPTGGWYYYRHYWSYWGSPTESQRQYLGQDD